MDFLQDYRPNTVYEGVYKELLKNRILYLNEEINSFLIDMVAMPIIMLNEAEKDIPINELEPLTIIINCPGGDIDATLFTVETIRKSRIPIHGRALSIAASGALYLLLACHKRVASENTIFLLHKGSMAFAGDTGSVEELVDFYKDQVGKVFDDLVVSKTKISADELKKIRRNETFCLGLEARDKYGFIDEII